MLLFQNKTEKINSSILSAAVVSKRQDILDSVRENLEIREVDNILQYNVSLSDFDVSALTDEIKYFIFLLEQDSDIDIFTEKTDMLLPKQAIRIAIGSCDSILLAEKLHEMGIFYVFYPEQMAKLGHIIDNEIENPKWTRSSLKISVLGCKGGVGTSSLSYYIADSIVSQRNISMLLVQGCGGSMDMDLISKKDISNDVTQIKNDFFVLYEQRDHALNYTIPLYDNYDFVIFDHAIHNADSDAVENILSHSNCVLLVCNHDLSSIKNARKVISYNQHLQTSHNGVKKIIICFNENKPKISGAITVDEVSGLIGEPVDIVIPYMNSANDPSQSVMFSGKNKFVLDKLVNMVLGKKDKVIEQKGIASLLGLMGRK